MNYDPNEYILKPNFSVNNFINNYGQQEKLERMFNFGDEDIDFLGIGYDEDEMQFMISSNPVECKFDEKTNQIVVA